MTIDIDFLTNEAGEGEGVNNAGIATYLDRPYASAAREVAQNSRDASAGLPVRISFDLLEVPFEDVPALDKLRRANGFCLNKVRNAKDTKAIAHFEQAARVLENGPLKILRIADYNTVGLRGPAEEGTPFHSLIMSSGVSVKENDASGGSFGIGKNAIFAISDIQTVLYSTVWKDSDTGTEHYLAQGKAVLVSHRDDKGNNYRATAYWGVPRFKPIENRADAPAWLRRDEVGTSVFALGFRESPQWQQRIAYALLENFFYAVNSEEMEFTIGGGSIVISRSSLASLFEDPQIAAAAEADDHGQEFTLARQLYQCLVSPEAKEQVVTVAGLGKVLIRVLVAEGLPKKVCIVRNGMVITDSLENFGDKFSRFALHRDFAAVVVPLEKEGGTLIKRLENPRHDGLSAERLPDEGERARAKAIMKRLIKTIRETIRSHSMLAFDSEMSVDEMRNYFAVEAQQDAKAPKSEQEDPNTLRYRVEPRRPRTSPHATVRGTGESGGPRPGPKPGPGPGPGPGPTPRPFNGGGGKSGDARTILLRDVRNRPTSGKGAAARSIFFTPEGSGMATIAVEATGLSESEDLRVVTASDSAVKDGTVRRHVTAGERTRVDIEFAEPYSGPIELRVSVQPDLEVANEA
jgi:hypothetical protein